MVTNNWPINSVLSRSLNTSSLYFVTCMFFFLMSSNFQCGILIIKTIQRFSSLTIVENGLKSFKIVKIVTTVKSPVILLWIWTRSFTMGFLRLDFILEVKPTELIMFSCLSYVDHFFLLAVALCVFTSKIKVFHSSLF